MTNDSINYNNLSVDYIIIGQGICGTFLSYYLYKAGKKIIMIDEGQPLSSTRIASGIINPVTGRRVVSTWMIEELKAFAQQAYTAIGNSIGEKIITQKNILAFPASTQMREAYNQRLGEENSYIRNFTDDENNLVNKFNYFFGAVEIDPVLLIELHPLLNGWRKILLQKNSLMEEKFENENLNVSPDFIQYKNIKAQKIFFCDGINSFSHSYWRNLPYIFNKGEALIVDVPGLQSNNIYKFGNSTLVPWYNNLWWLGSSYENEYEDILPTKIFLEKKTLELKTFLKLPFTIVDHYASLRPAAVERRPFMGFHPLYKNVGILNGMGTKGCSLAPFFAKQFVENILGNGVIDQLVDVKRFARILSMH